MQIHVQSQRQTHHKYVYGRCSTAFIVNSVQNMSYHLLLLASLFTSNMLLPLGRLNMLQLHFRSFCFNLKRSLLRHN